MLKKKGYLAASTSVYTCTEHTPAIVNTPEQLDPVFKLIKECEEGRNIDAFIGRPVCHAGFKEAKLTST